jgi:hypothetical protein
MLKNVRFSPWVEAFSAEVDTVAPWSTPLGYKSTEPLRGRRQTVSDLPELPSVVMAVSNGPAVAREVAMVDISWDEATLLVEMLSEDQVACASSSTCEPNLIGDQSQWRQPESTCTMESSHLEFEPRTVLSETHAPQRPALFGGIVLERPRRKLLHSTAESVEEEFCLGPKVQGCVLGDVTNWHREVSQGGGLMVKHAAPRPCASKVRQPVDIDDGLFVIEV